ncbi:MAG TPA: transketolase C-terminal domain-containing protein, partial [Chryseosolibacter sp.]|nr:transketolase C-terminal domain-containing protein [Chryseosolibacter sp.]
QLRDGEDIAILTIGHVGNYATEVCKRLEQKGIEVAHFDMRFVKPLDEALLLSVLQKFRKIITVEDGCLHGGFGSAVLEFMADQNLYAEVKRLGIPDRVIEHGEQIELHRECGFDPGGIEKAVIEMLEPIVKSL